MRGKEIFLVSTSICRFGLGMGICGRIGLLAWLSGGFYEVEEGGGRALLCRVCQRVGQNSNLKGKDAMLVCSRQ